MEYARKCYITGKGMNEGWVDENADKYFKNNVDVIKHIKELMIEETKQTEHQFFIESTDDILEIGYNHYGVYYTEWDDLDAEYEEINGVLTEIE